MCVITLKKKYRAEGDAGMATSEWLQLLSSLLQLVAWLLVLAAFVYTLVSGLFWHVRVRTGVSTFGHMCLAYKWIETGSKTTIDTELAKLAEFVAKRADHKHYLMIIRYDNDSHVSTGERMRCAIGVVLALGDPTSGDPGDIDEELENALLLRKDFKMCLFTRIEHAVIAEFPNRTRLARRLIGTRVYPKLKQFIRVFIYTCIDHMLHHFHFKYHQ